MKDLYRKQSITTHQQIAYALPSLSIAFLMGPMAIVHGVYAKHFGLALTTIGAVLLISRFFDAVTDPIIGYFSDRYYAHNATRKPFMVAGGLLFILSSYFLFVPHGLNDLESTKAVSTSYFLGWFLAFYLAYTLFEIPHQAWGGELVSLSKEKNTIYTWRTVSANLGLLLFYALPLLPIFETDEFTPETLKWSVSLAAIVMMITLYLSMRVVPNQCSVTPLDCNSKNPNDQFSFKTEKNTPKQSPKDNLKILLQTMIANKPFLLFLCAFFLTGMGLGACFSLLFIYVDSYLGLGNQFAKALLIATVVSTVCLGAWHQLAARIGKQWTWSVCTLSVVIGILTIGTLTPNSSHLTSLAVVMVMMKCGYLTINGLIAPSLLSDIIDYSILKSKTDCGGTYFSTFALIAKSNTALGGAVGLAIAGFYGFDAAATSHSDDSLFGLRLAMIWLPASVLLLSVFFIILNPINTRRHAIIRRQLDAREKRQYVLKKTSPDGKKVKQPLLFIQTDTD